jgi:SpoIID/LytB domain protein
MSQDGALQMAREGKTTDEILNHYFTGIEIEKKTTSPRVLVNLDANKATRSTWTIAPGYATGYPSTSNPGDTLTVEWKVDTATQTTEYADSAGPFTFGVNGDGNITVTSAKTGTKLATFPVTALNIRPKAVDPGADLLCVVDTSGPYGTAYARYQGYLQLKVVSGKLRLVNSVGMEHYLDSVVAAEIGKGTTATRAAQGAQAICAASFVYPKASKGTIVSCTTSDQVYKGHSYFAGATKRASNSATSLLGSVANAAVKEQLHRYVTYKDAVVAAYFCACNGDATANSEDVWGSKLGYLRSVADPYCAKSHTGHAWTVVQTGMQVAATLKAKGASVPTGAGSSVYVSDLNPTRGTGGWVKQLEICWSNGSKTTIKLADNVRIKLGLKAANFAVTNSNEPTGATSDTTPAETTTTPAVTKRTYQENNALVKRARGSWKRVSHKSFSAKKAYRSRTRNAKITLRFTGTAIAWYGQTSPGAGRAKVYIDGKYKKTVNLKSAKTKRVVKLYSVSKLSAKKTHRFSIVVTTKKNSRKYGYVYLDKVVVTAGKLVK